MTNRYLYSWIRYFPYLLLTKFTHSGSSRFKRYAKRQFALSNKKVIILGNAPSLNNICNERVKELMSKGFFVIGLNRSFLRFDSHVLLWADIPVIKEGYSRIRNWGAFFVKVKYDTERDISRNTDYWVKNQGFKEWNYKSLFLLRTILTSGLHLAYLLKAREIYLVGVEMDKRTYFTRHPHADNQLSYERMRDLDLFSKFKGYSTQRITKEVIEYLVHREGIEVYSLAKNSFLENIEGLKFKEEL